MLKIPPNPLRGLKIPVTREITYRMSRIWRRLIFSSFLPDVRAYHVLMANCLSDPVQRPSLPPAPLEPPPPPPRELPPLREPPEKLLRELLERELEKPPEREPEKELLLEPEEELDHEPDEELLRELKDEPEKEPPAPRVEPPPPPLEEEPELSLKMGAVFFSLREERSLSLKTGEELLVLREGLSLSLKMLPELPEKTLPKPDWFRYVLAARDEPLKVPPAGLDGPGAGLGPGCGRYLR